MIPADVAVVAVFGSVALLSLIASLIRVVGQRRTQRAPEPPLWLRMTAVHMAGADPRSRMWKKR